MNLIITGAVVCCGHYCTLGEFGSYVGNVLVSAYADRMDLDIHVAETHVVEVRALQQSEAAPRRYELRLGGTVIATAREAHPELRLLTAAQGLTPDV